MKRIKIALEESFIIEVSQHLTKEDFKLSFNISAKDFLEEVLLYLEVNDFLQKRRDMGIFKTLYIKNINITSLSIESICKECFICEATLFRYRQTYIKLIRFFIKKYNVITITIKN